MATGKRQRRPDDVNEDEEVEVESASSSFRQNGHKRSRVAIDREQVSLESDNDDDNLEGDDYADDLLEHGDDDLETRDPAQDLSMDGNDNSDVETEGDEINEFLATQIVEKQFKKSSVNIALDEGIIEEVTCRNFMCHSKLRIQLGPNINFIIGHNGSGKSAVLTALTMCLGGKATQTNRGASLKSLIKEGQDSATLGVKIKNQGENAYRPKDYGRSIIVERYFTRSGTSGFKIKNEQGNIISTRRADLDDILDYFGLQLNNPINVLTQDMARQFLSNSTPTEKYKFFIRGTMLENLDADYKVFEENLDNTEEKLRVRADDIELLHQKFLEAERRKQRVDMTARIYQKIREVERQHAWAQVIEQEELLQKYTDDAASAQQHVEEREQAAATVDARFEAADQAVDAAKRAVEEHQEQRGPATERHAAEKGKFDANKQELLKLQAEQRSIKESFKKHKEEVKRLEREKSDEETRLTEAGGDAHTARLRELDDLKTAFETAKSVSSEHTGQQAGLDNARALAANQHLEAQPALKEAKLALQAAQGNLSQLQNAENERFTPFSQNMETLCKAIDKETRWRSKPVGPFGLHLQLLRPEWSSVLEKTFGGVLNAFAVTNRDDATIFNQIARRVGCVSSVYIGRPEPLDTSGTEPDEGVDTVLRVLKFTGDSDLVRNQLIINQAIEQTVLIRDRDEAYRFMYDAGGRPHNVKVTLSLHNDQRTAGHRWEYTRSGAQKTNPIDAWKGLVRMQTDRTERLNIERARVDQAKRAVNDAEENVRHFRDAHEKSKQALEAHKRRQNHLRVEVQEAEDALEAKQAEIDSNRPQDGKLQELQRQLEEAQSEKKAAEDSLEDCTVQKDKLDGTARELKALLEAAQRDLDAINGRLEKADENVHRHENTRHELLFEKNAAHDDVQTSQEHLTRLQSKVDNQQGTVDQFNQDASTICARVPVDAGLTIHILDDRLEKLREKLREEQQRAGGDREQVTAQWHKAKKEHETAKKQADDLNMLAQALKETLKERHRRWGLFRKYISARARINFGYLLSERNFRGRVFLDHMRKLLDIAVEPDLARASDAGRQAKTLSGGEKSFSTICLLLSIWEAMGSPIRCLDEFDVFMDSVNRQQSMRLMIQAARRSVGKQFILITPQSMGDVDMGDDVKIHKMTDPERGQQTLSFHGQEL